MTDTRFQKNTTILFVLAVFLAWPTFGLSFIALFCWVAWSGYSKGKNAEKREAISLLLEPLFRRGRPDDEPYSNFIGHLDLPIKNEFQHLRKDEMQLEQCGRLVSQFFAHNPREATVFVNAIHAVDPCDESTPGEALYYEAHQRSAHDLRIVCFRAVKALITNNNLTCFEPFNLIDISAEIEEMLMEQKAVARRESVTTP